jgi:hypothetical protein
MVIEVPAVLIVTNRYIAHLAAVSALPPASLMLALGISRHRLQIGSFFHLSFLKRSGLHLLEAFAS